MVYALKGNIRSPVGEGGENIHYQGTFFIDENFHCQGRIMTGPFQVFLIGQIITENRKYKFPVICHLFNKRPALPVYFIPVFFRVDNLTDGTDKWMVHKIPIIRLKNAERIHLYDPGATGDNYLLYMVYPI